MNKTGTIKGLPALRAGRVHELWGRSALAFVLLALRDSDILFCGGPAVLSGLNADGFSRFLSPKRLIHVFCPLSQDADWAMETALRHGSVPAVVLFAFRTPGLTAMRRFQLAAQAGGTLGFVIVEAPGAGSAAETRWSCDPIPPPSSALYTDLDEMSFLNATLHKNKRGPIGSWNIHISWTTDALSVDAHIAGEPVRPEWRAGR